MLAIWSLAPLPFLNPSWTSGSSRFTYCWSLAWRILSITLLACEMSAIVQSSEHSLALPSYVVTNTGHSSACLVCMGLVGSGSGGYWVGEVVLIFALLTILPYDYLTHCLLNKIVRFMNMPSFLRYSDTNVTCAQLYLTLCNLMNCSLSGSSVCKILQARVLEWIAISFSRGSSWPRDWTCISWVSCIAGGFFTRWAIRVTSIEHNSLSSQQNSRVQDYTLALSILPLDFAYSRHLVNVPWTKFLIMFPLFCLLFGSFEQFKICGNMWGDIFPVSVLSILRRTGLCNGKFYCEFLIHVFLFLSCLVRFQREKLFLDSQ